MTIETDFNKEFEKFRKICIELHEKSKKDEMKSLILETDVEDLKKRNHELEGKIKMIKKVLVYSSYVKRKAESEVCFWKKKVKELESKMDGVNEKDGNVDFYSRVRKRLLFEEEGCVNKAQSPFRGVIDVSEEDVSYKGIAKVKKVYGLRKSGDLTKSQCSFENDHKKTDLEDVDEEHVDEFRVCLSNTRSAKRKRAANIVVSDDEDSSDDNVPICTRKAKRSSDESEDGFDEYKATLEKIGRKKISNLKWDLEGDMLADFGKDLKLCMSAVCALYRQQTDDEKASKVTRYHNERGFSQTDAFRASKLAEFLTDGDSDGDLNKTVKELKVYSSKGVDLCRTLAIKYSKQLFQIYQNKEDPYFPPQR